MNKHGVSVAGQPLEHRLYHFRLAYSGFGHAHVVLGGESYVALAEGLRDMPIGLLGACLRNTGPTASRSAGKRATGACPDPPYLSRTWSNPPKDDLTDRTDALCGHYGMTPPGNTKGMAHENGAIEGPHGHLKRAIADALIMRGSHDFEDLAGYRRFIDEAVGRTGARNAKRIDVERTSLSPLPARRTTDCEEVTVRVTSSGGARTAQGLLHRAIPADRSSVAGADP
jgi:hypothetical protein